jgi:DNA mismatch endonuclease (patch repair protein)
MAAVRVKNTRPELEVRRLLYGFGYRYRLHAADLPGRPDIVFRGRHCVIFVNGCFWHGHSCSRGNPPSSNTGFWLPKIDKNRSRDRRVQRKLKKEGWRVLVIWECELKFPQRVLCKAAKFLG